MIQYTQDDEGNRVMFEYPDIPAWVETADRTYWVRPTPEMEQIIADGRAMLRDDEWRTE